MINGEAILAALLSLRDATEAGCRRLEGEIVEMAPRLGSVEMRLGAMKTRFDRFEVKVLARFDVLDARAGERS